MYPGTWAQIFPEKPAIVDSATGRTITYRQLDQRSNQLAQLMQQRGMRAGDHIAVLMENHLCYFEVVWAALRSGLYVTPINRYLTAEEAGYILDDCGAQLLVTSAALASIARELPRLAPHCLHWLMIDGAEAGFEDYAECIATYPDHRLADEPEGQLMLYSSGTTGQPKGIIRPLSGARIDDGVRPLGAPQQMLWGFDEHTVYLSPAPLYHSAPIGFSAAALALGGTVIMMPRFDEIDALAAIEKFRVTHSQWVPTMFVRMLKLPGADRRRFDLSSHQVAIHAAAPCPVDVKRRILDWWGPILYEYYGGTEMNGLTHCTSHEWLDHPGTVGRPIIGVLHVCDEQGDELPTGEPGLVYFEQPAMPFSYHGDDGKTRSAQHPRHTNWTALGDVGYVDADGYLYLTDRATFMIISGGVNIYPQEIENQIIMHPKVADVAVIGVPDPEMGEAVKAIVQVARGVTPDAELANELLAYARQRVAHYKCPRSVDFIDELPRLPTGKLYKRVLKDRYWGDSASRIV